MRVMNVTPQSQLLKECTELGGFSIWEKGSEDTIVASLQDSNQPPYSRTTAKWNVEHLMQELDIDCSWELYRKWWEGMLECLALVNLTWAAQN